MPRVDRRSPSTSASSGLPVVVSMIVDPGRGDASVDHFAARHIARRQAQDDAVASVDDRRGVGRDLAPEPAECGEPFGIEIRAEHAEASADEPLRQRRAEQTDADQSRRGPGSWRGLRGDPAQTDRHGGLPGEGDGAAARSKRRYSGPAAGT